MNTALHFSGYQAYNFVFPNKLDTKSPQVREAIMKVRQEHESDRLETSGPVTMGEKANELSLLHVYQSDSPEVGVASRSDAIDNATVINITA